MATAWYLIVVVIKATSGGVMFDVYDMSSEQTCLEHLEEMRIEVTHGGDAESSIYALCSAEPRTFRRPEDD